jgi:sensor histidine kinase YesM
VSFGFLFGQFHFGIWALAFVYPFAVEDARMRALEAERLASAADLARLRAHLEPHFLLNTLNAIAGLVTEEPREARRLLAALGDLLRDATQDGEEMRPIAEEIAWLRRYAEIFEARYGSLTFHWEIDARAANVLVPHLLFQPLVENAVKHGALQRDDAGSITIAVRVEDDMLECVIADDGPGMPQAPTRDGAFGLDSVKRRLSLKDPRSSLVIESASSGTRAIVRWPIEGHLNAPIPRELPEAAE